ncbi:alpha/beta hydrolase [Gordonia soli]|uniref:DUF1023 domain-containing protein n=1 Tax=Gordonia soli NBRC 108243 TaxID=1223545 RepID=M0QIZ4_9ACTN|nr:alpha/beta hydrolase [Gordonia soli]GAC68605.1 hypothetical protein GS4_16_01360 [Gordonia soli NBRC 108243]
MPPTISTLRGWNPHTITAAGDAAQTAASTLDGALDAVVRAMDSAEDWHGQTHDAAGTKVNQERDHADEVRNVLNQIADEAKDAAQDLTHSREFVLREVDGAIAGGFTVSDTGDVTHPDDDKADTAKTLQASIKNGLNVIGQFDQDYGTRIANLKGDLAAMVNGQPDVTLPDGTKADPDDVVDRLKTMHPTQVRNFLAKMTDDDVRRLVQADPHTMGNLNGVPFPVRANANEISIRNALADERQAGNGNSPRAQMLEAMLKQKNDPRVAGDRDNDFGKDSPDDHMVERQFISFENTKNGRFIEMIGNYGPGTRNATVYVPGTGSNLNGSGVNYNAAWDLAHETRGPVFVYMDGDLPQKMGYEGWPNFLGGVNTATVTGFAASLDGSAVDPDFARDMAPRLVGFGKELDIELAEHAPGAQTTFIGHSYGGSVVGSAEQLGLRADKVIYASSAGTGVFDGPWHNPNPNVQRFSLTAPGDLIQYVQGIPGSPHGGDPDVLPGVTRLDTGYYDRDNAAHPGGLVEGPSGHGDYWNDKRSTAFQNMVKAINDDHPTPYVHREDDRPTDDAVAAAGDYAKFQLRVLGGMLIPGADIPLRLWNR